jgi:hypothetical protein
MDCSDSGRLAQGPRVRFFLNELRAQQNIDSLLDGGPPVIIAIDRLRRLDELRAEVGRLFAAPNLVFNLP